MTLEEMVQAELDARLRPEQRVKLEDFFTDDINKMSFVIEYEDAPETPAERLERRTRIDAEERAARRKPKR